MLHSKNTTSRNITGGKKINRRGKNFEYRIVYKARDAGLEAERVERSGAGDEKGDVIIEGRRYECKYRSNGLKTLYKLYEEARDENCNAIKIDSLLVVDIDDFFSRRNRKYKCFNNVKGIKIIYDWIGKAVKDGCDGVIVKVKKNLCLVIQPH